MKKPKTKKVVEPVLEFLPVTARPYERAILIVHYVLGITNVNKIQNILGQKSKARIYKTMTKYQGKISEEAVLSSVQKLEDYRHHAPFIEMIRKVR